MSQPAPQPAPAEPTMGAPAKDRRWLGAVLPVVLIAACAELGIAVLNNSALPVYLTLGLHLDTRVMGFILVPFFISEALLKAPLGVLSDRFGRKPLMLGGALITVFTPLAFVNLRYHPAAAMAAAVLFAFGVLRLLDGLGQSALWPSLFAYIGDRVEERKRGTAMGLLNVTYLMGLSLGFLAGGFVDDTFGPLLTHEPGVTFRGQMHQVGRHIRRAGRHLGQAMQDRLHHHHALAAPSAPTVAPIYQPEHYFPSFYLASVLFTIATIVILLVLPDKVKPTGHAGGDGHGEKVTWQGFLTAVRSVPQFLALAFVTFLGIGCLVFVVKLFAMHEFGLPEQQVGVLMLGPALFIAAVSVPVGQLADKWGKTRAVRLGFILCAVGLWGIPLLHHLEAADGSNSMTGFIVSASVLGMGFVLAFPAWMALITSVSEERQRGTILGAISTAQGIGVLVGSQVGTALYQRHPIAPFVASATLVTVGALLALAFVRERALPRRSG